jgi:hypothetical protein
MNWVPKVHPTARAVEPNDPMTLHATPVAGDPDVMLRCLVQEYAWMGWDAGRILDLFHDPAYPALNGLLHWYGEAGVRERVAGLLRETGVFHFRATVREEPEPDESEPELIELGIRLPRPQAPKGENHAAGL